MIPSSVFCVTCFRSSTLTDGLYQLPPIEFFNIFLQVSGLCIGCELDETAFDQIIDTAGGGGGGSTNGNRYLSHKKDDDDDKMFFPFILVPLPETSTTTTCLCPENVPYRGPTADDCFYKYFHTSDYE